MRTIATIIVMAALLIAGSAAAVAQSADEIVERYLAAVGGRTALAKLKSEHMTGTVAMATPVGPVRGTVEGFRQAPNKSRRVMRMDLSAVGMGEATVDERFDGNSGYFLDTLKGNHEITGNALDNLRNQSF